MNKENNECLFTTVRASIIPKMAIVIPLLLLVWLVFLFFFVGKASLGLTILDNFHPVRNILFWGKMLKYVMEFQL